MTVLNTPEKIECAKLMSIRSAMKLEAIGMKCKGRSRTMIAKELLGLSRGTPSAVVAEKLTERIEGMLDTIANS